MSRDVAEDRAYQYYPAFLDLCHKRVLVVGGGEIATGKVRGLLPCGPHPLVVIAPAVSPFIRGLARAGRVTWHARDYLAGDLAGADLCFAATDDREQNAEIARAARANGVLVLAVDDVPNCDFIAPSVVRRGDLILAFSTGGRSPAMARWVRERFDRAVPADWAKLLAAVGGARERLGDDRRGITPETWLAAIDEAERQVGEVETAELIHRLLDRLRPAAGATGASRADASDQSPLARPVTAKAARAANQPGAFHPTTSAEVR